MTDNYNSFTFFDRGFRVNDFKDDKIPDNCIVTSWGEVIKVGRVVDMGDYIRIQSDGETVHLDKVESQWPVNDDLIKKDISWWEKFKRKFKCI